MFTIITKYSISDYIDLHLRVYIQKGFYDSGQRNWNQ